MFDTNRVLAPGPLVAEIVREILAASGGDRATMRRLATLVSPPWRGAVREALTRHLSV